MPKRASERVRPQLGDVIEIETSQGLAYAQYTHEHREPPRYGSLLRITKLGNDTAPKSGKGSDEDRLSMSPQSIRRGGAEYTNVGPGEVQTNAGDLGYDKNTLPTGVEPGVGAGASA
jgi:hypothetical protein